MKLRLIYLMLLALPVIGFASNSILVEAESFEEKGGWKVDPQFSDIMGSPYLLAHGYGTPVANAKTEVVFAEKGNYNLWVRTKNWVPGNWEAPGRFKVVIDGNVLDTEFGTETGWGWQQVGGIEISKEEVTVELKDLTGFAGRCDAIYFSKDKTPPPNEMKTMRPWRNRLSGLTETPPSAGKYDLVVIGGGIAGCGAALAAERAGLNVAIIHDRPVFGGNASSEIRVHTLGISGKGESILKGINTKHWPNSSPLSKLDDKKREATMNAASRVSKFRNWRAYSANVDNNRIVSVDARHNETGECKRFFAPVFVDSTGDGWIGYWAGAEYSYGRESKNKYGESYEKVKFPKKHEIDVIKQNPDLWSPEKSDNRVMGTTVMFTTQRDKEASGFPEVPWAVDVAKDMASIKSEWFWEFTRNDLHQIDDAEYIRDHMFRAIYGSFYNAKKNPENANVSINWVAYISGRRESRRLIGDHIFTQSDAAKGTCFKDTVVEETRAVDVHYQRALTGDKLDFQSKALFGRVPKYYIPFRSLYSKNIENLMMAGRCFSCSHIGLGGPRVMNTTGQMGIAVGYAASLCINYEATPRGVYENHIDELRKLIGYSD